MLRHIISLKSELHSKQHTYLLVLAIIFGCLIGTVFAFVQCRADMIALPSLPSLCVYFSSRSVLNILTVCCLFSLLLLLAGCTGFRLLSFGILFFLKGFSAAFLIFVFAFFYHSQGIVIAAAALLFHSFLLLPLQMVSAVSLMLERQPAKSKFAALSAINAAAAFACFLCERYLLPSLIYI